MKFRKAKTAPVPAAASTSPAAPPLPTPAAVDAAPLRKALATLDKLQAGIADFLQTIEEWKGDVKWCEENLDPRNDDDLRQLRTCRDKVELAPVQLRKEEGRVPMALDALLSATRAFDAQIVAAGHAEHAALRAAIAAKVEPALAPILGEYRMDAAKVAAAVASGFAGLRHIPMVSAALQKNPDGDYMLSLKEAERYFTQPTPGATAVSLGIVADFEKILRARATSLLAAAAVWESNGGSWVPADFDQREPIFTVEGVAAQPTYRFAATTAPEGPSSEIIANRAGHDLHSVSGGRMGGLPKRAAAPIVEGPGNIGGWSRVHAPAQAAPATPGAPAVDLQKFTLPALENAPGTQGSGRAEQ